MEYRPEESGAPDSFGTGRSPKQPPYPLMAGVLVLVLVTVNLLPFALRRLKERVETAETVQQVEATLCLPEKSDQRGENTELEFELSQLDEAQRRYWNLPEGVMVGRVPDDSAAYAAGLRAGDVITAIGEQPVENLEDYHRIMDAYTPGDCLHLQCYRDGQLFSVELTLTTDGN